ncbi:ankyrin [Piromyces finnis]|uniref:Ankyrin n=1 Tax=Piromyces finnis TaxID=1754191 RepID=A0A1Y1UVX0_9FUNG|nr:ankyrin [Piromyces finnis]|eukprot:ORX42084.1 ankyrin [Piromyces finnis]
MLKLIVDSTLKESSSEKCDFRYINLIINFIIKFNNFTSLKYIIENNYKSVININEKDINEEYPIIKAFYKSDAEIFEYLLSQGGNYKIKNNNGDSLLSMAIKKKKYNIIQCLLRQHIDINEKDINGKYPFIQAIKLNDIKSVQLLMEYGIDNNIDLDVKNINGSPPLILSYRLKFMDIFYYLLK